VKTGKAKPRNTAERKLVKAENDGCSKKKAKAVAHKRMQ